MVYHYTTQDALKSILEKFRLSSDKKNLIFWASSAYHMNDPMEIICGFHVLMDYLVEKEIGLPENVRLCNYIKDAQMSKKYSCYTKSEISLGVGLHFFNSEKTPFVISLSKEKDSLPMWKMYADNGNGVCLCFDEIKLQKSEENQLMRLPFLDVAYVDVHNSATQTVRILQCLIDEDREKFYELMETVNDVDRLFEEKIKTLASLIPIVGSFIKEKAYGYEKEKRLVHVSENIMRDVKFRTSSSGNIVPYMEIPLPIESLEGIMLGPCNNDIMIHQTLPLLLKSCGLDNITIESSSISCRTI